ncbi:MAG: hypothetical protein Q4F00_03080 [bacterium]|nr:hypothetical protein [bacterium]
MSDNAEALKEALELLQTALKELDHEEMAVVRSLQKEVDDAVKAGSVTNAKLEFCYTVKFSQDRISNPKLLEACEAYIKAAEQ